MQGSVRAAKNSSKASKATSDVLINPESANNDNNNNNENGGNSDVQLSGDGDDSALSESASQIRVNGLGALASLHNQSENDTGAPEAQSRIKVVKSVDDDNDSQQEKSSQLGTVESKSLQQVIAVVDAKPAKQVTSSESSEDPLSAALTNLQVSNSAADSLKHTKHNNADKKAEAHDEQPAKQTADDEAAATQTTEQKYCPFFEISIDIENWYI